MTTGRGTNRFFSSIMAFGLGVAGSILAAGPAAAQQQGVPFAQTLTGTNCDNTLPGISCNVVFGAVPANQRLDVTHVTCKSILADIGSADAEERVELDVINVATDGILLRYFLIPVEASTSNFVVSEQTFVPIAEGRRPEFRFSVLQGQFGGGSPPVCTISGLTVTLD